MPGLRSDHRVGRRVTDQWYDEAAVTEGMSVSGPIVRYAATRS